MTRPLLTAALAMSVLACGEGALPLGAPEHPTELPTLDGSVPLQRFALTSLSDEGWSLDQRAAAPPAQADLSLRARGRCGALSLEVWSSSLGFCSVGSNFASTSDVAGAVGDCTAGSFIAGGSSNRIAVGDGYLVTKGGQPFGQLRVVDHTIVPASWDGSPVHVTLEFSRAPR
jgi:hypothetical protein